MEKSYIAGACTYWKRSAPHPGLMAFDTPTRETCTLQRPTHEYSDAGTGYIKR